MDFSTIKAKMEAKDGTGYNNVREICADVRLIFKNAMKYNDERNDVHVMAKTLLAKFEEKWLQLLPKVDEEVKKKKIDPKGYKFLFVCVLIGRGYFGKFTCRMKDEKRKKQKHS